MQIIIANTNIQGLLKATDKVLEKYGRDGVPENIKGQVSLSGLKSLFESNHFSICKVDQLLKMNDVHMSTEHYNLMNSLHCVDFKDMTSETREYIFAILVNYFRSNIVMSHATGVSK